MTPWTFIRRNLAYHARGHVGVGLGGAVATAVLAASLLTGDSVRGSLERQLRWRLGQIQWTAARPTGRFRVQLAHEVRRELRCPAAAVLQVRGVVTHSQSQRTGRHVVAVGVDTDWIQLSPGAPAVGSAPTGDTAWVNARLADELGVRTGDDLILRVARQVGLPSDVPLAADASAWGLARFTVGRVLSAEEFGRFCIEPEPDSPPLVVVARETLARLVGADPFQANLLLIGRSAGDAGGRADRVWDALRRCWDLADWDLTVSVLSNETTELRSRQVFLAADIIEVARRIAGAEVVMSYLVNTLSVGDREVPYCFVAGREHPELFSELGPNDIVLHEGTAAELSARIGDQVRMEYFMLDAFQRLVETSALLRVATVVPFEGWARDPNLMPEIPGLTSAQSCREWRPALPLDLKRIRSQDEEYWRRWRGAPRAFVRTSTAMALWSNRFGVATTVRWQGVAPETVVARMRAELAAAGVGWHVRDVREEGVRALRSGPDFRGLCLGLGIFMLVSAWILEALMFALAAAARRDEWWLLHSIGFGTSTIRRWYGAELAIVAAGGAIVGVGLGVGGARALVHGLRTVWKDAIGDASILSAEWTFGSVALALAIGWVGALVPTWPRVGRWTGESPNAMDTGARGPRKAMLRRTALELCAWALAGLGVAGFVARQVTPSGAPAPWVPLIAGMTVLMAGWRGIRGLSLLALELRNPRTPRPRVTGWSQLWRHPSRTLGAIVMPACGWFVVGVVDVHRARVPETHGPDSPTGGFAMYGESTLALPEDPATRVGRQRLGLDESVLQGVNLLALRRFGGADASCRNPQRVAQPPILGVPVQVFDQWNVFAWAQRPKESPDHPWVALELVQRPDEIPAVLDASVARWNLRVRVGDHLVVANEAGRPLRVRIVGLLQDSIFQGHVLVSERQLALHFPSAGRHVLLVRTERADVAKHLLDRLTNYGLDLKTTRERLARFWAVQHDYLEIFYWFSAWGLWLGALGLGSLAYRNVVERRRELAMLHALGWELRRLRCEIWREQISMAIAGWVLGWLAVVSAAVTSSVSPWRSILGLGSGLVGVACASVSVGTWAALHGLGPQELRNE